MSDPLSTLYDAALGESDWDSAVAAIARECGANTLVLGLGNPRQPEELEMWNYGWDMTSLFEGGYALADVWNPTINPGVAAGMVMPVGRSMHAREMIPDDTFDNSHFLQSTVVKNGVHQNRLFVPLREPDLLSGGFFAKAGGKDFHGAEIALIDRAIPHVGRALRLREQLNRHRSSERNLSALLEALSYGVMLLDQSGRVVLVNSRCEMLLQRDDGISIVRGRAKLGAKVEAAIATALSVVDLGNDQFPMVQGVPVSRPSSLPPYLVRIYPGIGFASLGGAGTVRVALLIDDPLDPNVFPEPLLLRSLFGLSKAEIVVAQLVPRVSSRRAIAEVLGLSENTVKTHLASIRAKVGASSTSELAQILIRTTLGPPR